MGQFIAVGHGLSVDSAIITSPDGVTWVEQSNPRQGILRGLAYSPSLDLWVAVGGDMFSGNACYIITSADGITWVERISPQSTYGLQDVHWNDGIFVAVGKNAGIGAFIITSSNGIDWTEQTSSNDVNIQGVAYSLSLDLWVAVGVYNSGIGGAIIITSPDAVTWTLRTDPKGRTLNSVIWGDRPDPEADCFVAVGNGGPSVSASVLQSYDGLTWYDRSPSLTNNKHLRAVTYHNFGVGRFGAVGDTYSAAQGGLSIQSQTGLAWNIANSDNTIYPRNLQGIAWNGSRWVAVGQSGYVITCDNEFTFTPWTVQTTPNGDHFYAVEWGEEENGLNLNPYTMHHIDKNLRG